KDNLATRGLGLQLVVPSFDGHVYVIDGTSGCTSRIDVGEHITSSPLVEDLDGDGSFDLLLGTLSGQVHLPCLHQTSHVKRTYFFIVLISPFGIQVLALDTHAPYDPLYAWASKPRHRHNGFTVGQLVCMQRYFYRNIGQREL